MPKAKPTTIAAYINAAPPAARPHLRALRALLKQAAPEAKQGIKWGYPAFETRRILFAFGAFKTHLNFMPTPSAMKAFKKELAPYRTGMGSIQFPYDKPLPKALIKRIAARRVRDLNEKDVRWM